MRLSQRSQGKGIYGKRGIWIISVTFSAAAATIKVKLPDNSAQFVYLSILNGK
jgi:hypothetical protein